MRPQSQTIKRKSPHFKAHNALINQPGFNLRECVFVKAGAMAAGHREKFNDLDWRVIPTQKARRLRMRNDVGGGHSSAGQQAGSEAGCQHLTAGYVFGWIM
jgi:hypothetical protein